jgi:hypothetical protein
MYLSSLIKEAYRNNSIVTAYVYGPMGYGKTSYALWTAYEVLGSWDRVLKHLFFNLDDVIRIMRSYLDKKKRIPILILDDAGFFINRLTWWEEEKIRFMELLNLARTLSAGIIFTTPSEEIPRQIINKVNFRVSVRPLSDEEVADQGRDVQEFARSLGLDPIVGLARGYQVVMLPSFMKLIKKEYIDYYPLYYPVFQEYEKIRMRHIKKRLLELSSRKRGSRKELLVKAIELYERERDSKAVYNFLKDKLPPSTAHRWAFQRIPYLVGRSGYANQ